MGSNPISGTVKNFQQYLKMIKVEKTFVSLVWLKALPCHGRDRPFKSGTEDSLGIACTKGARMSGRQSVISSILIGSTIFSTFDKLEKII